MPNAKNKKRRRALILVGVTGGMGSGKSTVLTMFRKKGAFTLDADVIVHRLLDGDAAVLKRIRSKFGSSVFDKKKRLDKRALAAEVFSSKARREKLERIIHPRVRETIWSALSRRKTGVAVIDIPLLYESKWQRKLDAVVVVDATMAKRIKRLRERGFSPAKSKARINAQMDLSRKVRMADFVVNNNGTKKQTKKQVDEIWKQIPNMTHGGN